MICCFNVETSLDYLLFLILGNIHLFKSFSYVLLLLNSYKKLNAL